MIHPLSTFWSRAALGLSVCVSLSAGGVVLAEPPLQGLWLMGQSLCEGAESLPLVSTSPSTWGNLSFQRGVRTWIQGDHSVTPQERVADGFRFIPLQAGVYGGAGETIANGLADHLKATLPGMAGKPEVPPHYLVTYAGQGGRGIEELSIADQSVDPRTPEIKRRGGGYYATSLDDARRAVGQARELGKGFAITALVWMQGEANGGPTGGIVPSRWEAELPPPAGQEWYRGRLMAYRKQWSSDLRAITGQPGEIPLFTYQTLGPAGYAQLMAADLDPHLHLVGPHYMVPSAINSRYAGRHGDGIHLAADGERWYGEQVAKVVRRVLVEKEDWQPLRPRKATLDTTRTQVLVDFTVPRPPLVIDETFLPRQQSGGGESGGYSSLAGFQFRNSAGAVVMLKEVRVVSPTQILLTLTAAQSKSATGTLSYGLPHLGDLGVLTLVRPGADQGGQPTTELVVSGIRLASLRALMNEGTFFVANTLAPPAAARAPVRHLGEEGESAVIRIENRELREGVSFGAGQKLVAYRPFSYGNLRDSDSEKAIYTFTDRDYGSRAGQPYPLWNWCVLFNRLPVGGE